MQVMVKGTMVERFVLLEEQLKAARNNDGLKTCGNSHRLQAGDSLSSCRMESISTCLGHKRRFDKYRWLRGFVHFVHEQSNHTLVAPGD